MTFYNNSKDAKVKVIPHSWASGIVVLMLYRAKKLWLFKRWKFVDSKGIDWPEHRGIMQEKVNELFNKHLI